MKDANQGAAPPLDGRGLCIGIVQARYNASVTDALGAACAYELLALGVAEKNITRISVPGALEIPLTLQAMAQGEAAYHALIALGCVIRGETYHFELVANESSAGITRVALDHGLPVVNAILTTEDMPQAVARQREKGRDAARVAVEMALLIQRLTPL